MVLDNNKDILSLIYQNTNNKIIIDKINARLEFGKQKYGHGIILDDDTTKYASSWDSASALNWTVMCLEEMLDGIVYSCASILKSNDEIEKEKIKQVLIKCVESSEILLSI